MNINIPFVRCLAENNKEYRVEVNLTECAEVTDNASLRNMLTRIYSALHRQLWGRKIYIETLLVPGRNVSGASIMDLEVNNPLRRTRNELKELDFSHTPCSNNALLSLDIFPNLERASFDGCKKVELFSLPKPAQVRFLSLLDTKVSACSLKAMLTSFPRLESLRVTLYPTMHYPLGLSNWAAHSRPQVDARGGHLKVMKDSPTFPLRRLNVEFYKVDDVWHVVPLDAERVRLIPNSECYIHTRCSQLHSKVPANSHCVTCNGVANEDNLLPFHQELDSTLDMEKAFAMLPQRPAPTCPWEIIERALEAQGNNSNN